MSASENQRRGRAKVFVVDDHPLVRDGLAARLMKEADMEVCGEADNVEQAVARIRAERPDVVIVDLSLGQEHGLDLLQQVQRLDGQVRMLVLSTYDEALYAERALRAGAMGYVNKSASWNVVVEAIRTVLAGRRYLSPKLAELLLDQTLGPKQDRTRRVDRAQPSSLVDALTDRELEVFRLIGLGLSTGDIAHRLFLSKHTIDSHRENIKRKLKLASGSKLRHFATLWVAGNP
jgi:DNA-binding NarL/FixJ family response regulator